jgi:LysM repeat protein
MIQPGDTLLKIAWRLGFPSWAIIDANPGLNPDALLVGTTLVIPSKDALLPLPAVPHKRIVLSISDQKLWAFQDGNQIQKFIISTGIDRSPTQPGISRYKHTCAMHMPRFGISTCPISLESMKPGLVL